MISDERAAPMLPDEPTAEQLAEVARMTALAIGSLSVVFLAVAAMAVLAPDGSLPPGFHPLVISFAAALGPGIALAARRRPQLFPAATMAVFIAGFVLGLGIVVLFAGPSLAPLFSIFFFWFATTVGYLPRRLVVALLAWVGVVFAGVLALQDGHPEPLIHWQSVVGATIVSSVLMNRQAQRARALAGGEQDARAQAEAARAELEAVSADKTRFLARMSHELRTPLNAIIGFSEVLARRSFGELNAKQAEYVGDVVDSGRHLLALVDDLLDLSKVETGSVELAVSRIELVALLSASVDLFQEQAGRRQIALRLDTEADVPAIEADARKLKQVVFNLLANAVRFTPAGGQVTLSARRVGDGVSISVSDTGPGIAREDQEAIFEEFRQSGAGGGTHGGTGLGLPLARRLVEAHGGRLWVESEPGEGSVFTAELPARPRPVALTPVTVEERVPRLVLGEPDSPERRAETARLLKVLGWSMVGMGLVGAVTIRLHPVLGLAGYDERAFMLNVGLGAILMLAVTAQPQRLTSPVALPYLGALGVGIVVLAVHALGPLLGSYVVVFCGLVAVVIVALPRPIGILYIGFIGLSLGVIFAQAGHPLPVARWLLVMEFTVVSALIWNRLFHGIQRMFVAERTAREEAERLRAELEVASRHKTAFLANMSHELRTPLNAIIGFSEVLAGEAFGPLNEKQAEYVADVLASGRHLLGIINDILDLAKADAGRMELQVSDVDLEAALGAALLLFQPDAGRRSIDLTLEAGSGLGAIEADEAKLTQTLRQLVSNALKFTHDGGRVTLRATRDTDQVEISVTDTGRGDYPVTPEQGPELGLVLARRYAELHGGSLTVRSATGTGATFTLRLPVRAAVPAEVS